jgi:hypothetical protein
MPLMRDIDTHGDFEAPAEADGDKKDAKDDDALSEGAEEPEQSKKRN